MNSVFAYQCYVCVYFTGMKGPMKTIVQTLYTGFTLRKEKACSVLDRTSLVRNAFETTLK
jgi:hypothetical protein